MFHCLCTVQVHYSFLFISLGKATSGGTQGFIFGSAFKDHSWRCSGIRVPRIKLGSALSKAICYPMYYLSGPKHYFIIICKLCFFLLDCITQGSGVHIFHTWGPELDPWHYWGFKRWSTFWMTWNQNFNFAFLKYFNLDSLFSLGKKKSRHHILYI